MSNKDEFYIDNDYPIDIDKLNFQQLEEFLKDDLVFEDIKEYQNSLLKKIKDIKSDHCQNYVCKLQDIALKEMVIVNKLLEWLDILMKDQKIEG